MSMNNKPSGGGILAAVLGTVAVGGAAALAAYGSKKPPTKNLGRPAIRPNQPARLSLPPKKPCACGR